MKTTKAILFLFAISMMLLSCEEKNTLEGLWQVEKVKMGENEMTPIARWMKFNADGTQTSGNGWLKHSYGTWSLNGNVFTAEDENGIRDEAGPFTIEINQESMTWKREEEGQQVTVILKRIQELPQSGGNKLIGLWKLTKATDDGNDITAVLNPDQKSALHLRWDNTYVQHNMPKGRNFGVYKIHGHKPEIQMVNYGNEPQFSFWSFSFEDAKLTLVSTDKKSTLEFERINQHIR